METKKRIEFTLPWPPSINNYYGRGKHGQVYLKPTVKKYFEYVPWLIKKQTKNFKFENQIEIKKIFCPPDKRRRDEDDHLKAINDALTKSGIIKDDSYRELKYGTSKWIEPKKPGYVKIIMEEI
jgi:crossover junction endodeoxyribonuclease RusA